MAFQSTTPQRTISTRRVTAFANLHLRTFCEPGNEPHINHSPNVFSSTPRVTATKRKLVVPRAPIDQGSPPRRVYFNENHTLLPAFSATDFAPPRHHDRFGYYSRKLSNSTGNNKDKMKVG
jgi:hypothetical protein